MSPSPTSLTAFSRIAVLDTETIYSGDLLSVGVVIAKTADLAQVDSLYIIFTPEYIYPAMYSSVLWHPRANEPYLCQRAAGVAKLGEFLQQHHVDSIFAYNAAFDRRLLPELSDYAWYDILKVAANRNYNSKIPACLECSKNGRLKRGYGVQPIYRYLADDPEYYEVHNALCDAEDELKIMQMLNCDLAVFKKAKLPPLKEQLPDPEKTGINAMNRLLIEVLSKGLYTP